MKSKFSLLSLLFCILSFAAFSTETESNDTKATANKLTLNNSNTGAIGSATDVDWWKVTTTSDGKLDVTLAVSNALYCYFQLYDNDGTTLLVSSNTNGTATISKDGLAPGTYFIYLYPYYAGQLPAYTVSNVLTLAALANDPEPNGLYTQANTIALNSSSTGHVGFYYNLVRDSVDWWKFTTTSDGRVRLKLAVSNSQYVYWQLYDNNGTTVLDASHYISGTSSYDVDGLAAGTYFVKIFCYYTTGFAPYTLTDSLFAPTQANDVEPNGTSAQAINLALNSTVTGHVGYYYNVKRDTFDYYKLVTTQDGMISLTLSVTNNQYTYVQLLDNNGTTVLTSNYNSVTTTINTDGLAAGTYYAKVFMYYTSNGFAPYTLTNTLTTYANANDGLSNDYAKLGATLPANTATTGHVGFRFNGGSRDSNGDWWKINYTGSGNLTVTLNFEAWLIGGIPYTYLQIWKDTALSPIFNSYNSTGTVTATLTGLTQGYYYVKVITYYNTTQWAAYNITPTFTQTTCVSSVTATKTHSGKNCIDSYITFQATGGLNQLYLQLYRYGVAQGTAVAADITGSYKFDNLSPGNYTCVGYSEGATSGCNATSVSKTVIPKVTGLSATNITATTADVNWTTFSCVKYYYVQYRVLGDTKWKKKTTVGNVGTYHLTGLTALTTYEYRVAANDSLNGEIAKGKYSTISTFGTTAKISNESSLTAENNLSVYPNPASNLVKVNFNNGNEGLVVIKIFDVTGKVLVSYSSNEMSGTVNTELNLSELAQGIYKLQIITADGAVLSQSIVKGKE